MSMEYDHPLIFNIRRFSLDDGPGIRSAVFLKGCPLSCIWCHNPESMSCGQEIAFYPDRCIQCGDCQAVCKEQAIDLQSRQRVLRDRCTCCGRCADICPTTSLKIIGRFYPVDELVDALLRDRVFYETSGGGVTFSGGEPTMHPSYVQEVMKKLKQDNIHIAIQTSGMFNLPEFEAKLLPYIDLIYFDIKLFDDTDHRKYTGVSNSRILKNFTRLVESAGAKIIPRVPLVPNITATRNNLLQISDFLRNAQCSTYELLRYDSGGIEKRRSLGKDIPEELLDIRLDVEKEKECFDLFSEVLGK